MFCFVVGIRSPEMSYTSPAPPGGWKQMVYGLPRRPAPDLSAFPEVPMRRPFVPLLLLAVLTACRDTLVAPAAPESPVLAKGARDACQTRCAVTLEGWYNSGNAVRRINDRGEILGWDAQMRWVVEGRSGRRTLQPYHASGEGTYAHDLNDRGEVAGTGYRLGAAPGHSAILWAASGALRDLGSFGAQDALVSAMNDRGDLTGTLRYADGSQRPFVWSHGKLTLIPLPAGTRGEAVDINNHGQVAGTWHSARGPRAFTWSRKAGFRDLGDLGGGKPRVVYAAALNDRGWVVGVEGAPSGRGASAVQTPFLWTPEEGMRSLGSPGGEIGQATDVNARGEVVGQAQNASGAFRAFVWSAATGMRVLDAGAGQESVAASINDRGDVLGSVFTWGKGWKATVWTSDPAALRRGR